MGRSLAEVLHLVERQLACTYTFAVLDTFTYLRRSGRVNALVAALGGLMQIKPIIKMHRGEVSVERARTQSGGLHRVTAIMKSLRPLEQVALVHADARRRAEELLEQVRLFLPYGEVALVDISPVIGAHIGPGALGFVCVTREAREGGF
jgi:DegV family protein with EDD domain